MAKEELRIGCSGYHYDDWKGVFYPKELKKKEWLNYYAGFFRTVEINNSFYRLPKKETFENWASAVPENFDFTVKGSRFITHMKKLKHDQMLEDGLEKFYEHASALGKKLGCVLWQLPGNFHKNLEKINTFCNLIASRGNNVIEFRHNSWFTPEVYDILREYKVGFCIISAPGDLKEDVVITSDIAYLRFHGQTQWYNYKYSAEELEKWAAKIKEWEAKKIYIYFNNDYHAHAIDNGMQIKKMLNDQL